MSVHYKQKLHVVILAAGRGQRMGSLLPKVLHTLCGESLLKRVWRTAQELNPQQIYIVYNPQIDIRSSIEPSKKITWVCQEQPLGTGHAVQQVLPLVPPHARILVLYGDVPLVSNRLLSEFLRDTPHEAIGLMVAHVDDPRGLGRIVRDETGSVSCIVEECLSTPEIQAIHEINTGIFVGSAASLVTLLSAAEKKNTQKELFLTDVVACAVQSKKAIYTHCATRTIEITGINTLMQLNALERAHQLQKIHSLCAQGVRVMDPTRLDLRSEHIQIESDVCLDVNVVLSGTVRIAHGAHIGVGCVIRDSEIGADVVVLPYSVIEGAHIAQGACIGPFARIRERTIVEEDAQIGNFVEVKNSTIGRHSKAKHLTYLGDAEIESEVNIGAGTVICNYDGMKKSHTRIQSGAFIGSNSTLIAPIVIGHSAFVGAGSILTKNAPDACLTLARSRQKTIKNWSRNKNECH